MDEKKFYKDVLYYKEQLGNVKGKLIFVVMSLDDEKAFYSIAPLSRALNEAGADLHVAAFDGHSPMLESMLKIWKIHNSYKKNEKTKAVKAFKDFVGFSSKKAGENLEKVFRAPDYILRARKEGFTGSMDLDYRVSWMKKRKEKTLFLTCTKIWKEVYNLKNNERVALGFETIPEKKSLEKPLRDYLDSYAIVKAMADSAKQYTKNISLGASTPRDSMLKPAERISDLKATIIGCELSKNSNEAVFKRWKNFSRFIGASKIRQASASFFISGAGYPGKHAFGQMIGYPTPNGKSRWQSPGGIIYQPAHAPQTRHDSRAPKARVGFTETLPIEVFINTNNIDWEKMKQKNEALAEVAKKSDKFVVKCGIKGKYKTEFEVFLVKKDKTKRKPLTSDVETRNILNKKYYQQTGIKAGTMSNIPGGEMFITPEYVRGRIVGDVVINIDESHKLTSKSPMIIDANKNGYRIKKGPKKIIDLLNKKKAEARKILNKQSKAMPKELIELRKKNFNNIGEFAINTNPKAKVCDYLIVNEKIANMIHVALGSGFEDDKATDYHSDIVIDAPRQKLDIYGIDKEGNVIWVMKKGKLIV